MKKHILVLGIIILIIGFYCLPSFNVHANRYYRPAQNGPLFLGAYYFDGWTGHTNDKHLPKAMIDSFSQREPKWGWITSTPAIMKEQIDVAANAGLSFFCFCYFYRGEQNNQFTIGRSKYLNHALNLFISSPNISRLKFSLMVINQAGYEIGPEDWNNFSSEIINYMKNSQYVRINNKPIILFYSLKSLVTRFGSTDAVRQAFDLLKKKCVNSGVGNIEIGCSAGPATDASFDLAKECGIDDFTAYNYASVGFKSGLKQMPIKVLQNGNIKIWNLCKKAGITYIPCVSLNWDARAWASMGKFHREAPYYVGYSSTSVFNFIKDIKNWANVNYNCMTPNRMVIIYAWNEYGEGAWLTPSRNSSDDLLNGLKRALKY